MKKLLTILGAIGIVASSATSVVACGGKGGSDSNINEDSILEGLGITTSEKNAYYATSDIAKSMLIAKSENVGNNVGDILTGNSKANFMNGRNFATYSPMIAQRFSMASSAVSTNDLQQREANHYALWSNNFHSKFLDDDNNIEFDADHATTATTSYDFINNDKLSNDSANIDGTLNYLLSSADRSDPNFLSDKSGINNNETDGGFLSTTKTAVDSWKVLGSDNPASIFLNASPDKISLLLTTMSNILNMTVNKSGIAKETDDTKGTGNLRGLWYGQSASFRVTTLDQSGAIGLVPAILEQMYNFIKNNENSLGLSKEVIEYLVGSNDESQTIANDDQTESKIYPLITNVFNKADVKNINTSPSDIKDGKQTKWFEAKENTGLYGKIINQIGSTIGHKESNYGQGFDDKLSKIAGFKRSGEPIFEDPQFYEMMESTVELFEASNVILGTQAKKTIFDFLYDTYKDKFSSIASLLSGLSIKNSDQLQDVLSVVIKILEALLNFDRTKVDELNSSSSAADIENAFTGQFKLTTLRELDEAGQYVSKEAAETVEEKHSDWFMDQNKDYRNAVYKALGVDTENGNQILDGHFFKEFQSLTKEYKDSSIFNSSDVTSANDWIFQHYDANIIDPKVWAPSDLDFEYNDNGSNTIKSVTYTLEYKGDGRDDVTKFKSSDVVKSMTQTEIYNKLADKENNAEFIDSYLGNDTVDGFTKVHHKYTVTWVNVSESPDYNDFVLDDITNIQAYIDNSWVAMQI